MTKQRKWLCLAVALIFALSALCATLFVAKEAGHQCSHDDCAVCAQLATSLTFFNNTSPKPSAWTAVCGAFFALVLVLGESRRQQEVHTLITLKVKLSD